ncbi:hypothetical protein [Streptosporangium sandarakinum]
MRLSIRMTPPGFLDRIWYWRIGQAPPALTGSTGPRSAKWARLVPYRFRRFHHAYATSHNFYWLPCPLCGREHGGHEGGATIPDPISGLRQVVCSKCSRMTAAAPTPEETL